jgi:hypothetical protein
MPTIIQSCSCVNAFQDALYGKGKRVWNTAGKKDEDAVCTVCEKRVTRKFTTVEKPSEKPTKKSTS